MHTIEIVQTVFAAFECEGYWMHQYINAGAKVVTIPGFQPFEKEGATRLLSRSTCFRFFESAKEYPKEILRVHTMRVAEEHDSSRIVAHRERADAASRTCALCLPGKPDSRASFEK